MSFGKAFTATWMRSAVAQLRRLRIERKGAAAIEFAFIAPILLSLYFVTMEVAQGIETNKKVGRIGSMVADLVTQQPEMTRSQVEAILKIGESIIQPYNRTRPKIVVTAIQLDDDSTPEARVVWSRQISNGSYSRPFEEDDEVSVPEKLRIPNTFLIRVSGELDYRPMITYTAEQKASLGLAAAFDRIQMREVYYLRPRMSSDIPCDSC